MSDVLFMGDVQGCAAELRDLLKVVGFDRDRHRLALRSDGAAFHGEWIGQEIRLLISGLSNVQGRS
jgi:hypothetical protein